MSRVVHLDQRVGTLCNSTATHRWGTYRLDSVTCTRCLRRIETLNHDGWDVVLERRHAERTRAAVEAVGLTRLFDFLAAQDDTPTGRMTAEILGSIAVYLGELGFVALEAEQAAA